MGAKWLRYEEHPASVHLRAGPFSAVLTPREVGGHSTILRLSITVTAQDGTHVTVYDGHPHDYYDTDSAANARRGAEAALRLMGEAILEAVGPEDTLSGGAPDGP